MSQPVALITGIHGFIGRQLAVHLLESGHRVFGLGHDAVHSSPDHPLAADCRLVSDIDFAGLDRLAERSGIPDRVFHLAGGSSVGAAIADPHADFQRSVNSTAILLEWLRIQAPRARLVAVSSAAVYGAGHTGPIAESADCRTFSPYGAHKLMMEMLCRSYAENYSLQIVLPRLFSVYGPGLHKQLLWDLCHKLAAEGPVELGGSGEELRDWTHIDDVVAALGQIVSTADTRASAINVASGKATPVREVAALVARAWGGATAVERLHFSGQARTGDPFSLVADPQNMHGLGISCDHEVEQGVAQYVEWFRAQSK